jgi:thiamine pyrophosphate-dependent acetolactate synthase large subunit-like protein
MRPFSQEHCRGKHVALRVFQPLSRFNDLDDWHFSNIAAPIGGVGERVTTRRELAAALDCAVKRHGQFSLVEVNCRVARLRTRWRASSAASNPSVSARQRPPL